MPQEGQVVRVRWNIAIVVEDLVECAAHGQRPWKGEYKLEAGSWVCDLLLFVPVCCVSICSDSANRRQVLGPVLCVSVCCACGCSN